MKMQMDLQKRFPIYHVCPECLAALLCGAAIQMKASTSLRVSDVLGKNIGWLVTWEFPLRTDSASWKSLESNIQFTSCCRSCILLDNSKTVFWSSMSFRLAIVSKVELWNFRNSSISARLCWWASRNSNFCSHSCPCRETALFFLRDDWLFRDIPRYLSVFALQVES